MRAAFAVIGVAVATMLHDANASKVLIVNSCAQEFELSHLGAGTIYGVLPLVPGGSMTVDLGEDTPSHVFKAGRGPQATLAEITPKPGRVYYDISIIPTGLRPNSGPKDCGSLDECKRLTGGIGFNLPMEIIPQGPGCPRLTCLADGCSDAYLFPGDNSKAKCCVGHVDLTVTFCPGGPTTPPPTTPVLPALNSSAINSLTGGGGLSETDGSGVGEAGSVVEDRSLDVEATTKQPPATLAPVEAPQQEVREVTTKSSQESSTGAEVYVLLSIGGAAMVAGAAIFVSRKKKRDIEALEDKTPRPTTTSAACMFVITSPQEASVL